MNPVLSITPAFLWTHRTFTMSDKDAKNEKPSEFGQWCQMTGWHGVLDFYIAKHMVWKVAWLMIVAVGCFFAITQAANMIVDFVSDDEWVTSISYDLPRNGHLQWPNITVCGLINYDLNDPDSEEDPEDEDSKIQNENTTTASTTTSAATTTVTTTTPLETTTAVTTTAGTTEMETTTVVPEDENAIVRSVFTPWTS